MSVEVSVIMPAYQAVPYMDEAIQSVLYQRDVSFELLIGDDASGDGTWKRICAYTQDPRVRIWRFKAHQGPGAIRNELIRRSHGKYLSICDADDVMLPDNLRCGVRFLEKNPAIGVICFYWLVMNEVGDLIPATEGPGRQRAPHEWWDLFGGIGSHGGSMIRRDVWERVGGYRAHLVVGVEDYDLFLRLAEVTKIAMPAVKPLYLYRHYSHRPPSHPQLKGRHLRAVIRDAIKRRYGYEWTTRS